MSFVRLRCESSYMGDSCVSKSEAEYQKYYAKCEIGKKHKKHRNDQVCLIHAARFG